MKTLNCFVSAFVLCAVFVGCVTTMPEIEKQIVAESPDHKEIFSVMNQYANGISDYDPDKVIACILKGAKLREFNVKSRKVELMEYAVYKENLKSYLAELRRKKANYRQTIESIILKGENAEVRYHFYLWSSRFKTDKVVSTRLIKSDGQWRIYE